MDEDFISRHHFAIFDGSDRGITLTVFTRAAAIAALLLAAACGGEPEVLEPDPTASSADVSSEIAPSPPPEASDESESGAATFTSYWLAVSDYASLTGNTDELGSISAPSCGACREYIDLYQATYAAGGKFTGGQQSLENVTAEKLSESEMLIRAEVRLASGTYQETADSKEQAVASSRSKVTYRLARQGDRWVMREFAVDD